MRHFVFNSLIATNKFVPQFVLLSVDLFHLKDKFPDTYFKC